MNNYNEVNENYKNWYLDLQSPEKFEEKRNKFLNYHQNSGLTRVQIEPTQRCNYSCEMCPIDELDPKNTKKDLSLDEFKLIIENLPESVNTICMSGLGEPFLNKDYINMAKYAKEKGYILEVYNNGSLFNKEILQYVDYIYFSVDALTKELIQNLRKGVKYDKLFDSIRESVKFRDEFKNTLQVNINFTISNKNYKEIPLLFDACSSLDVNLLQIQAMANNYSLNSEKYIDFSSFIKENSFNNWKYIIENYNNEYKFSLTIWYPRKLKGFCNWTFSSLYITKDLNIISCCHKVTNPLIFGNLKNKNLDEILKSEQIINFREKHISNENIPLCNNCPF